MLLTTTCCVDVQFVRNRQIGIKQKLLIFYIIFSTFVKNISEEIFTVSHSSYKDHLLDTLSRNVACLTITLNKIHPSQHEMTSLNRTIVNGYGETIKVSDLVATYNDVVQHIVPKSAKIYKSDYSKNCCTVILSSSSISTSIMEAIQITTSYLVSFDDKKVHETRFQGLVDSVEEVTSNHLYSMRVRNYGSDNQIFEILSKDRLIKADQISELEEHGRIVVEDVFANFSWNHNNQLVYVCQPKREKSLNFFKKGDETKDRGEEYLKQDNWGEALTKVTHTIIGIYDVKSNSIRTINVENVSLAQPNWFNNGKEIICVGFDEKPTRLGIALCNNRPSSIYIFDAETLKLKTKLSKDGVCYHGVRVARCGQKFLFLTNPQYGPHLRSVSINMFCDKSGKQRELASDLFVIDIKQKCFMPDNKSVIFTVNKGININLAILDTESGKLTFEEENGSTRLLASSDNFIVTSHAKVNQIPTVRLYQFDTNSPESGKLSFIPLTSNICVDIDYNVETIKNEQDIELTGILCKPKGLPCNQLPTICMVHGGPSSTFFDAYYFGVNFFTKLGFNSLLINYGGSIGYSDDNSEKLCGQTGSMDVKDCKAIIRHNLDKYSLDTNKLIVYGGSHGGFLSCHLSCQDEIKFKCAIIRNPVVNFSSMFGSTDIPDWVYSHGLNRSTYDVKEKLSEAELLKLHHASPTWSASKANVPTMLFLGTQDRRVKMTEGLSWLHLLQSYGVEVKCKVYDDKHSLDKPESQADGFVSSVIFMAEHVHKI